jgi:hypothetical protein
MRQRGHTSRLPAEKRGFTSSRTRATTRNTPFPLPETHTNATSHDGQDRSCVERKRGKIRPAGMISRAGMRSTGEAGCHPKSRQDVAAHLLTQHKTVCLLTLSPPACREAACREPVKRRFMRWSGRRDSNPRRNSTTSNFMSIALHRLNRLTKSSSTSHNKTRRRVFISMRKERRYPEL